MLTFFLLIGLVIVEGLPPLEEIPKEIVKPIMKCEHGFVHELVTYFNDVKVWVHVQDRKTGKWIDCNDI